MALRLVYYTAGLFASESELISINIWKISIEWTVMQSYNKITKASISINQAKMVWGTCVFMREILNFKKRCSYGKFENRYFRCWQRYVSCP